MMKYVIAGSTGFMGEYLGRVLRAKGEDVVEISRHGGVCWDDDAAMVAALVAALEGADVVVNLAGKSVNCRYTARNREEIIYSRTETTDRLGAMMQKCENPPKLWLNSSTGTIYRHSEDRAMDEETGEIGEGFSVEVAKLWEKRLFAWDLPRTRRVAMRTAIVMGATGGALSLIVKLAKFGGGGKQGNGRQKVSWLHIDDFVAAVEFFATHTTCEGVYNLAAPVVTDNSHLMALVREKWGIRFGLPTPSFLLTIGAWFIRTEPELVLKSRWVSPARLLREGFEFRYRTIEEALDEIHQHDR